MRHQKKKKNCETNGTCIDFTNFLNEAIVGHREIGSLALLLFEIHQEKLQYLESIVLFKMLS